MKQYYDQTAKSHPLQVGHLVWIYTPAVKKGLVEKLSSMWHGPFRLVEQISPVNFKVTTIDGKEIKEAVHVSRMKQHYAMDEKPTDYPNIQGDVAEADIEELIDATKDVTNRNELVDVTGNPTQSKQLSYR